MNSVPLSLTTLCIGAARRSWIAANASATAALSLVASGTAPSSMRLWTSMMVSKNRICGVSFSIEIHLDLLTAPVGKDGRDDASAAGVRPVQLLVRRCSLRNAQSASC